MAVIIFDIEASCDDKKINPDYNMETIEIGAVKLEDGEVIEEFQTFIKPEYVGVLTPFCTELTGITFDDLKDAPGFSEAILKFYAFMYGSTIYSCGEFDRKFLTREILEKNLGTSHAMASNAINSSHINLKKHFSKVTGSKMKGMIGMAKELEVDLDGAHHRALDDSRNLAKIYLKLEDMREKELKKTFNKNKLTKLARSINENHKGIVNVDGDSITIRSSRGPVEIVKQLDFFDRWRNVIKRDHSVRGLDYLSNHDIRTLNKYTKDLI